MKNIFEAVREAVPVPLAAERYGLKANHAGMVCCPFHDDRKPSLKLNEDYFYCFGCGAGGDVVELTRRLFDLRPYEAASKLAVDFGVDVPATAPPDGYAPRSQDDKPDDRYVEACQMLEPMDYMASMLAAGTLEQRIRAVDRLLADGIKGGKLNGTLQLQWKRNHRHRPRLWQHQVPTRGLSLGRQSLRQRTSHDIGRPLL